jgi:hypothetical protein
LRRECHRCWSPNDRLSLLAHRPRRAHLEPPFGLHPNRQVPGSRYARPEPRTPAPFSIQAKTASRADPAGGRRELPPTPANPRSSREGRPCSRRRLRGPSIGVACHGLTATLSFVGNRTCVRRRDESADRVVDRGRGRPRRTVSFGWSGRSARRPGCDRRASLRGY